MSLSLSPSVESTLLSFIITFLLEFIIYLIWFRKRPGKIILYALLINLFTWPLAQMIFGLIGNFIIIEICVFIVEAVLLKYLFEMKWGKAILLSLIANLLTAIVGLVGRAIMIF